MHRPAPFEELRKCLAFVISEAVAGLQVQESTVEPPELESNLIWLAILLYFRFSSSPVAQQVSFEGE